MDPKLFYSKRPKRGIRVPLKFQLHYTQPKNIVKIATTSVTTLATPSNTPSAVIEDNPSAVIEDTPSAVIEDTPSAVLEDTTSAVLEDTTSAVIEDTPSAVTEDTPSAVIEDSPLMIILSDGHYLEGNEIVFSSIDELNSFIQHSGLVSNDVGLDYVNVPSNGIDVSMNDADCVDVFPIDGPKSDTEHSVLSTQVTGHVDPDFFLESVVSPINAVNPNENVEVMAKRITRKGKRNTDLWKRNVRKSKHLKGEVHVNSVGVVVSAKSVKLATCKCRLKCNKNFSDNSRSMINHEYYALGDYTIILLSISLIIHCNVLVLYVDWSNFNAHCNMLMLDFNNFNGIDVSMNDADYFLISELFPNDFSLKKWYDNKKIILLKWCHNYY